MEIKPGQYIALVGASGCGKSTCVALLERFYDPYIGQILVDNIPVSDYHVADYRKCISLVSQEPTYLPPQILRLSQSNIKPISRIDSLQYSSWIH
jgi:ABC-type multidrug transport system fused ATPase/permease subunit